MMLSCIKYLVIVYNFAFWLIGVALLATTIFLYVDSLTYVGFGDTSEHYMTLFLLLMAIGAVIVLVGFLGCCGAIRENTCLLATYFLLCITMCVACGAAVWWSTENMAFLKEQSQKEVLVVVREKYGRGTTGATETIVDAIQKDFQCCGLKGYHDWATSFYNQGSNKNNNSVLDYGVVGGTSFSSSASSSTFKVPASCCTSGTSPYDCERIRSELLPPAPFSGLASVQAGPGAPREIHQDGCWSKFNRYFEEQWKWLIIVAVLILGIQFFAIILSCCLCCAISRSDKE